MKLNFCEPVSGLYEGDSHVCLLAIQSMIGAITEVDGCYSVPNISARGYGCKTNLPPSSVMRGAGRPRGAFVAEHLIRAVADFLNVPAAKVSNYSARS